MSQEDGPGDKGGSGRGQGPRRVHQASGTGRVWAAPGQHWGPHQLLRFPRRGCIRKWRGLCVWQASLGEARPQTDREGPAGGGLMEGRGFGSLFYGHTGELDAWGDSGQRRLSRALTTLYCRHSSCWLSSPHDPGFPSFCEIETESCGLPEGGNSIPQRVSDGIILKYLQGLHGPASSGKFSLASQPSSFLGALGVPGSPSWVVRAWV